MTPGSAWAHLLDTTTTQPSGCRGVSIAPCCSVNAAFLFAEPRLVWCYPEVRPFCINRRLTDFRSDVTNEVVTTRAVERL